jgi:predicted nucleotidyltransferase
MNSIIKIESKYDLTKLSRKDLISQFQEKLKNRVIAAYFFGSFARNDVHSESDLDLILIIEAPIGSLVQRAGPFSDLWDIYPGLDLIILSSEEFENKNKNETQGFWPQIKKDLLKII